MFVYLPVVFECTSFVQTVLFLTGEHFEIVLK